MSERENRFRFYSSPAKPPMQPSSVATHNLFVSPRGRKTLPQQEDNPPSQKQENMSSLENIEVDALNVSLTNDQSTLSNQPTNIDDLLREFRKELDSIKSMELYTPQRTNQPSENSLNVSTFVVSEKEEQKSQQPLFSSNNVTPSNISGKSTTESTTGKQKYPLTEPLSVDYKSSLSQSISYGDDDDNTQREQTLVNQSPEDFHKPKIADILLEKPAKSFTSSPVLQQIETRTPVISSTLSNSASSSLGEKKSSRSNMTELKVENMQLRNEVSKLSATLTAMQIRMEALEKNFDQILQMLIEQSKH